MRKTSDSDGELEKLDDPITGVIGDSGKYQLLMCMLIAFFEVNSFTFIYTYIFIMVTSFIF